MNIVIKLMIAFLLCSCVSENHTSDLETDRPNSKGKKDSSHHPGDYKSSSDNKNQAIFDIDPSLTEGWKLTEKNAQEKSTDLLEIINEASNNDFKISIAKGSIVDTPGTEAIANAANDSMTGGKAIDGVILKFADTGDGKNGEEGYHEGPIVKASQEYMRLKGLKSIPEGKAFAVDAGPHFEKIGVKYVIQVNGTTKNNDQKEYDAFYNALTAAAEKKATSIAVPGISTGIFGYSKEKAAKLFIKAALSFAKDNPNSTLKHIRFLDLDFKGDLLPKVNEALIGTIKK